jgi:hypothetical protein
MSVSEDHDPDRRGDGVSSTESIVNRFQATLARGEQPAIEDYLPAGHSERQAVLPGLVRADLQHRLRRGQAVCVESYLGRYPDLAENPASVVDLIVAEHLERQSKGLLATADEYHRRFPQYRSQLAARLGSAPAQARPAAPAAVEKEPAGEKAPASVTPLPRVPQTFASETPAEAHLPEDSEPRWGTFLPAALSDWLVRPERLREAGGMALALGGFMALIALLCLVSVLTQFLPAKPGIGKAALVTVLAGVIAAVQIWTGLRTRMGRAWAFWAGLLLGLVQSTEAMRFLLNHNLQLDGFAGIIGLPVLLLAVFEFFAYLFALMALHARPYGQLAAETE